MANAVFEVTAELIDEECYLCGIMFGMPKEYKKVRLEDGEDFYCPNGHRQAYLHSKVNKLEKELKETSDCLAKTQDARDAAEITLETETHRVNQWRSRARKAEAKLKAKKK